MTTSQNTPVGQPPSGHESPGSSSALPLPARSDRVSTDVGARLPRQPLKETRADLLEAAVRIVNEYVRTDLPRENDPPVDLLPFVRMEEVLEVATELARRRSVSEGRLKDHEQVAPLTPGAFYKAFADEYHDSGRGGALTAFHRLVTRTMVEEDHGSIVDRYISLGTNLLAQGESWQEVARVGVHMDYERWSATPALILLTALALHTRDEDVQGWTQAVDQSQVQDLVRMYGVLFEAYDLKLREGIKVEHLAVAVSDLIAGMALNARFAPESRNVTIEIDLDGRGKRPWHLSALAAWGIYNSFFEPKG